MEFSDPGLFRDQIGLPSDRQQVPLEIQLSIRQPARLFRLRQQTQIRFFRTLVAFLIIATRARRDNVRPLMAAAFAQGHHMVDGEAFFGEALIAVLANMVVAQKNILSRETHGHGKIGPYVLPKSHHRGQGVGLARRGHRCRVELEHFNFVLEPENHRFAPIHDFDRLVS